VCTTAVCGDGIIQEGVEGVEECDDGDDVEEGDPADA
jgi:cysteine-rich repeat protein